MIATIVYSCNQYLMNIRNVAIDITNMSLFIQNALLVKNDHPFNFNYVSVLIMSSKSGEEDVETEFYSSPLPQSIALSSPFIPMFPVQSATMHPAPFLICCMPGVNIRKSGTVAPTFKVSSTAAGSGRGQ